MIHQINVNIETSCSTSSTWINVSNQYKHDNMPVMSKIWSTLSSMSSTCNTSTKWNYIQVERYQCHSSWQCVQQLQVEVQLLLVLLVVNGIIQCYIQVIVVMIDASRSHFNYQYAGNLKFWVTSCSDHILLLAKLMIY